MTNLTGMYALHGRALHLEMGALIGGYDGEKGRQTGDPMDWVPLSACRSGFT